MKPPVVLVHGAYHSARCWWKAEALLKAQGIDVHCIDLPGHGTSQEGLTDMYGDAKALNELLCSLSRPPVLVGHSFGGAAISEAVTHNSLISHIIYIAAVLHDLGETIAQTPYFGDDWPYYQCVMLNDNGTMSLDKRKAKQVFYHDCSDDDAQRMLDDLCDQMFVTDQAFHHAPWKAVASTYVACENDRVLPFEIQQQWAEKCGRYYRLASGHMCMISHADRVAEIILEAVHA